VPNASAQLEQDVPFSLDVLYLLGSLDFFFLNDF